MRPGGGKHKGSAFEREVCKALSLWVTNGKRTDCFWRSAMSGGRATVNKGTVRQCGDICAVADEGNRFSNQWYIECKHVKKLALDQFLIKKTGPLANYWKVARREASKYKREPMVIAKQNGWPAIVLTRPDRLIGWIEATIMASGADVTLFAKWMESSYENSRNG